MTALKKKKVPFAVMFSGYFVFLLVFNSKIYCMKISIQCTSSNLALSFVEVKPNKINESEKLDLSFSICKIKGLVDANFQII